MAVRLMPRALQAQGRSESRCRQGRRDPQYGPKATLVRARADKAPPPDVHGNALTCISPGWGKGMPLASSVVEPRDDSSEKLRVVAAPCGGRVPRGAMAHAAPPPRSH